MSKYNIVTLEEVESTNSYALEFINFLEDKTVIRAIKQTAGRGRYNRRWVCDNSSNLYMTIILKPEKQERFPFTNLTQYLSVVVCQVLEKNFNIKTSIKWPNDILINDSKISGILAETSVKNNKIEAIALGLGLNVNLEKETIDKIDKKATSLKILKNQDCDTDKIFNWICDLFFKNYNSFIENGFEYIKSEYIQRCDFLGKNITIREENKEYYAQSIDDEGLLVVKDYLNNESKILTGDILC